jgi:hypothetical protein
VRLLTQKRITENEKRAARQRKTAIRMLPAPLRFPENEPGINSEQLYKYLSFLVKACYDIVMGILCGGGQPLGLVARVLPRFVFCESGHAFYPEMG